MSEVLVLEDSDESYKLISRGLFDERVTRTKSIKETIQNLDRTRPDMIVLDIEVPDGDGLKLLNQIQQDRRWRDIPCVVLSGHDEISNRLMAFSLGADDFIAKPFDSSELAARIKARIRKHKLAIERKDLITVGDMTLSLSQQRAWIKTDEKEVRVDFTSREFRLLSVLASHVDCIYSRDKLLDLVWGNDMSVTDRTVDVHIGHVRRKILKSRVKIETVVGEGYRLVVDYV